ncbi:hypothetical protein NDA11_007790 [Ustilago hordei]|uniref:Uncharacterized protein n=1 Tax=Ustilago hordei TaxID=120017 RepID=I2FRV5_USTHO|nr:uncharacterized protein UHO2_07295 [Ustilago hordei]KAJ1573610.1 hypothetical protein NDA11_007790 [Ustilago hordei]KAJ1598301.1 hypothetical protein NDA14_004264 [Ustilago hordei]CCF49648.1 uncharacterized protein UHOR_03158 [Ustilago hordei]SYW87158.1 uncharacterized protein UHO2_07295 [Ustilago hordei]
MLPIHSSDQHRHASNSGPVLTSTDMQTPAADASTTSTTLSAQDNAALKIPATTQEGTNESTSVPSSEQHNDGVDEAMEELYLAEPDQWAFQPIFTGRLIWLAKHSDKPIVPFEELPLPRSDQARVPPCTVCWQSSEISTSIAKKTLPEVLFISRPANRCKQRVSYHDDPTPLANTNVYIALITTPAGDEGGLDPVWLHAIPGYVQILTNDCKLSNVGHLQWCPSCKS